MIFVTVGSTLPFDPLIQEVDRLKASGRLQEPVLCQIGNGRYQPAHCEHFRFRPDIGDLIEQATLVIGHGGTGTTLELLQAGRNFIAVANPLADDAHQEHFLRKLATQAPILWTAELQALESLIHQAAEPRAIHLNLRSLVPEIRKLIDAC